MSVKLTEQQKNAIDARGRVIVSASAGSGKTFVMIERLVSLILGGADVRNTLSLTFTNKAAAQMRERLRTALVKKLGVSGEEERIRIKQQLSALPLADISTIHAFCLRLLRTHFYLAGVDPAFRVVSSDDHEGKLLFSRALDETLEAAYEEGGEQFELLLAVYFRKKKDDALRAVLTSLYFRLREKADYRAILEELPRREEFSSALELIARDFHERAQAIVRRAGQLSRRFSGKSRAISGYCGQIAAAADCFTQGDLFTLAKEPPHIRNAPPQKTVAEEDMGSYLFAKELAALVKKLYKQLSAYSDREEQERQYRAAKEISSALCSLLLRLDESYSRLKEEAGALDYNDLEHGALKVLQNEDALAALREKYRYVFVDEYQDVNPTQERILDLLGGEEVFLVGDAKQSIYGFRGSRSEFFLRKCSEFRSLELTENFRSAPAVLEAVNRVFSYAMTRENAETDYAEAPMRGGSRYHEHDGRVCFHRIPAPEPPPREEKGIYSVLQKTPPRPDELADLVCSIVAEEIGSEWYDADAGLVKKVNFGDIAVLARTDSERAAGVIAALSRRGIPVTSASKVNVCDFWEARLLIDWLSYLDDPEQDIPLAGALLSRLGGLREEDLVRIRLSYPKAFTFREAVWEYRSKKQDDLSEKLNTFAKKVDVYRALMRVRTAAEMIALLLCDGLEAEIAAKPDGEARLRRVRRLAEEGEESVNSFLHRLRALSYRVDYTEGGGENAVKVLTMHSAKGLEYPVVILIELDRAFHNFEKEEVLSCDSFPIAPRNFDLASRLICENPLRRAAVLCEQSRNAKEELNLLYVAMTRAKYRLHLLFGGQEEALSPRFAAKFADFFDFSACADYFVEDVPAGQPVLSNAALAFRADPNALAALREVYEQPYPHLASTLLPVKSSATDILHLSREETPASAKRGGGATVEEGLAYHAFLEHVRFGTSAREELSRMREEGLLSEGQLALLDEQKLQSILALPALRSLQGKRLYREQTFLVSLPAREIPALRSDAEDEIVLQGALDLLCEEEEGYLILDYKYSSHDAARLRADYAPQIDLYRKAVAKIFGVDSATIRARIINILGLFEVEM